MNLLHLHVYPKLFKRSIRKKLKVHLMPQIAITTILPKVNINAFTNYFYFSQENKTVFTKQTFNASPTSQKFITDSLLSRWGNDGRAYHQFKGRKKTRKKYRTYVGQWKQFCQDCNFSLTNLSISGNFRNHTALQGI